MVRARLVHRSRSFRAFFCAIAAIFALRADAGHLLPVSDSLDFGQIAPGPAAAPLDGVRFALKNEGAYRVVAVAIVDVDSQPVHDGLEILTAAGSWLPLTRDLPVEIATGAHAANGVTLSFPVRVNVTFDSRTGVRRGLVRFTLNGENTTEIRLTYEVSPAASAREISAEKLQTVDPTAHGTYTVERRTYEVLSNVPWTLEAVLRNAFTQRGNSLSIPDSRMTVIAPNEAARPLQLNQAVSATSGATTGSRARVVQLQFAVTITGDEPAGDYQGDVVVNAQPSTGSAAALWQK